LKVALDGSFGIWKVKDGIDGWCKEKNQQNQDFSNPWFMLIESMRVTSISFSPCENKVAISTWDGTTMILQKVPKFDFIYFIYIKN